MKRFTSILAGTLLGLMLTTQTARAGALTDYCENKIIDWLMRGQSFTPPANWYIGLIKATSGYSSSVRSTALTTSPVKTVIPATPNGRLYRLTTSGTTGSGEPTWCTTNGCTTNDGTAVWTEATPDLEGMQTGAWGNVTEVSTTNTNYARVQVQSSLSNWSGTQGSTATTASTGTGGTTYNNPSSGTITFPQPTASGSGGVAWGVIFGFFAADNATAATGNACWYSALVSPKTVNADDPAPVFAQGSMTFTIDQ